MMTTSFSSLSSSSALELLAEAKLEGRVGGKGRRGT